MTTLTKLVAILAMAVTSDAWIGSVRMQERGVRSSGWGGATAPLGAQESAVGSSAETLDGLRGKLMAACDEYSDEQKKQWDLPSLSATNTSAGLFGSQSRAEDSVVLNDVGDEVLRVVDQIAKYNPTPDHCNTG